VSSPPKPDFVVVGAGVIGSSIAYHLARAGADVLLADPGAPRSPSASWASAGGVRRQNRDPREWALTREAWRRWPLLEHELGEECGFRAGGHLHVAEDEATLDRISARATEQRAAGLDVELLDRDAMREIAPILSAAAAGGAYTRGDGHADPRLTTRAFQRAAVRHGARIRSEPITAFATEAGRVVGVAFGAEVVGSGQTALAAGSWSASLALPLGVTLPIRPQALQMLLTDPQEPVLAPTLSAEGLAVSFKQLATGAFLIGGGWPADVDPGGTTCTVRPAAVEGSWATAVRLVPLVARRRLATRWCGLEGRSMDGVPFIGPVPGVPGLQLAAGFTGHGFQLSPAVGRAVADVLLGHDVPELDGVTAARLAGFPRARVERFLAGGS
jgi:sarcosine oxidase, subunit beta